MANIINKNEKTNIIIQALLVKIISDEWSELTKDKLLHFLQCVDLDRIPDRTIADNNYMHELIPWYKVDRMKIIRLVARNDNIANFVDLSKYNYTVKEVRNMLRIRPQLIDRININLDEISHQDAFILLTIGIKEISSRVDVGKYNFIAKEIYEIIEYNDFDSNVIRKFNLTSLKDYHICDIIINTGLEHFDILDINKLTARKWIEILSVRPKLLGFCNLEKFFNSDIYNSIEFVCLFPDEKFYYLIDDRNYKDEVSALGWEKLIILNPKKYLNMCCLEKLNETNWKNICNYHPKIDDFRRCL